MVRAAVRPPRGLPPGVDLAAFVAPASSVTARHERRAAAAPVIPLPLVPGAPAENGAGGFSIARQLGLGVSRIVIDPGHGGKDPGASGSKTTEAEVVLDVALRVEKILAAEAGIEVVLTRRTRHLRAARGAHGDGQPPRPPTCSCRSTPTRAATARRPASRPTSSTSPRNADAAAVAARENAAAVGSMRNLPDMVRAITQGNKRDESRELAGAVQESMVTRLRPHNPPLRDLGVKQAPFVVLIGAGMPSVLAEIAFISHDGEGGLLRTEKYRQRIADALAAAVIRYTRTLKPVGTVAAQETVIVLGACSEQLADLPYTRGRARSLLGACSEQLAETAYNGRVFALFQAVTPVVELPAAAPAREVGPADVLIGSIGLVGALALLALMAGLLFGGLFILRRRAEERRDDADEPEATRLRLSEPPSGTP